MAKPPADPAVYIGPEIIKDVFRGLLGNEKEDDEMMQDYFNLMHYHQLRMEQEHDVIEERRRRRQQRREEKKREEDQRRLAEMRNNLSNLNTCAATLQKYIRRHLVMKRATLLRDSLADKMKKRALVIICNSFEDRRVVGDDQHVRAAFELVRTLQHLQFNVEVLSSVSSDRLNSGQQPNKVPTKANISQALESIRAVSHETLVWVHVCSVGGTGAVNGKNPFRQQGQAEARTPRSRLIRALSNFESRAGGSVMGDVSRFIFPSDGRSARLTFDNIVTLEELLDVVHPRHTESIYKHTLAQRIVTFDISPIGCIEGHQSGGFAGLSSSASEHYFYDMAAVRSNTSPAAASALVPSASATALALAGMTAPPPAAPSHEAKGLYEPHTSLLTHALIQCLVGHCWAEVEGSLQLCIGFLTTYVSAMMRAQGASVRPEVKPVPTWGDFTILSSERSSSGFNALDKLCGQAIYVADGRPVNRRRSSSSLRPLLFQVTARIRIPRQAITAALNAAAKSAAAGVGLGGLPSSPSAAAGGGGGGSAARWDLYDHELSTVFAWYVQLLAQHDPSVPLHRHQKVTMQRGIHARAFLIGIHGTFVEAASRAKSRGATEAALWAEVVAGLTGFEDPSLVAYAARLAKEHEGGGIVLRIELQSAAMFDSILVNMKTIESVLGMHHVFLAADITGCFVAPTALADQLSIRALGYTALPSTMGVVPSKDPRPQQLAMGDLRAPSMAPAFTTQIAESATPRTTRSGGGIPPPPTAGAGMRHSCQTGIRALSIAWAIDHIQSRMAFTPVPLDSSHLLALFEGAQSGATATTTTGSGGGGSSTKDKDHAIRHTWWLDLFSDVRNVCLTAVEALSVRLNDLEDVVVECAARRERPLMSPYMSHVPVGCAFLVVAIYGNTFSTGGATVSSTAQANADMRAKQSLELSKIARTLEVYGGVKVFAWDVQEHAASAAKAEASRDKDHVLKLLETMRLSLGTNPSSYPALLLMDFHRKRFYRVRQQSASFSSAGSGLAAAGAPAAPSPVPGTSPVPMAAPVAAGHSGGIFSAQAVMHFCEEFMRGALNELLPPVKGSKIIGGGVSAAKYSLIPM